MFLMPITKPRENSFLIFRRNVSGLKKKKNGLLSEYPPEVSKLSTRREAKCLLTDDVSF